MAAPPVCDHYPILPKFRCDCPIQPGLFSYFSGLFANQWNDIYFRIRENNQVEATVMNSETGRFLISYVEVRDVEWSDKEYYFFCENIDGLLWVDYYKEYSFPTP